MRSVPNSRGVILWTQRAGIIRYLSVRNGPPVSPDRTFRREARPDGFEPPTTWFEAQRTHCCASALAPILRANQHRDVIRIHWNAAAPEIQESHGSLHEVASGQQQPALEGFFEADA